MAELALAVVAKKLILSLIVFFLKDLQANPISHCGKVFITISSLEGSYVELNWVTNCSKSEHKPDTIVVYEKDVREEKGAPPKLTISTKSSREGYYKTKYTVTRSWDGFLQIPGDWNYNSTATPKMGTVCYPFWVASYFQNELIDANCFKLEPSWMGDHSETLEHRTIGSLVIPGTHDSGSYIQGPVLNDYVLTQEMNIYTQLLSGIRYFDLRTGYFEDRGFTIMHGVVDIQNYSPVIEQILKFIKKSPKEVIVIDFHNFPMPQVWSDDLHMKFISYLNATLVPYAIEKPNNISLHKTHTLKEIWAQNKNLVLSYSEQKFADKYSFLWPPLRQIWANTVELKQLKTYMEANMDADKNLIYSSLMAELTPAAIDLFLHINPLREIADKVNLNLSRWLRHEWKNKCNIIATDFYFGNDVINLAIKINTNKL